MRRFYYIRPNLQQVFTLLYTFVTITEILLFGIALLLIEKGTLGVPADLKIYWKFFFLLLIILVISAFNFWLGAKLSHRVAGPLVQIQRILQHAVTGNYRHRIHMRSSDYLHEIADKINLLMEDLERRNPTNLPDETDQSKRINSKIM